MALSIKTTFRNLNKVLPEEKNVPAITNPVINSKKKQKNKIDEIKLKDEFIQHLHFAEIVNGRGSMVGNGMLLLLSEFTMTTQDWIDFIPTGELAFFLNIYTIWFYTEHTFWLYEQDTHQMKNVEKQIMRLSMLMFMFNIVNM
jgi:hypothetical protein